MKMGKPDKVPPLPRFEHSGSKAFDAYPLFWSKLITSLGALVWMPKRTRRAASVLIFERLMVKTT
jgi:hypothetical protein